MNRHSEKLCYVCSIIVPDIEALKSHIDSKHIDKINFICSICFEFSLDIQTHDAHVATHAGQKSFKCEKCLDLFANVEDLKVHRKNHLVSLKDENAMTCQCLICSKLCKSERSLGVHMKSHGVKKLFKCEVCAKDFSSAACLDQHSGKHLRTSAKDSRTQYECSICSKVLYHKNSLTFHMNIHTGVRPFKCDKCPKDYIHPQQLADHRRIHLKKQHGIVQVKHECSYCPKTYISKKYFGIHMKSHTEARPSNDTERPKTTLSICNPIEESPPKKKREYKCSLCAYTSSCKRNLIFHMNFHSSVRPYKCDQCPKEFYGCRSLQRHLQTHLLSTKCKLNCSICAKTFNSQRNLDLHIAVHNGAKPYMCSKCPAEYADPESLRSHRQEHIGTFRRGDRPFKCQDCSMMFACRISLKRHRIRHTGDAKHECTVCGKKYFLRHELARHERKHSIRTKKKSFQCDGCSNYFTSVDQFSDHRDLQRCKGFDRSYPSKGQVGADQGEVDPTSKYPSRNPKEYTNLHNMMNKFKCGKCNKEFISERNLAFHSRVHVEE